MKILVSVLALGGVLILGAAGFGQGPVENISPERHPNLAAAQHLMREAYDKIVVAQNANDWDMKGHAKRAQALLDEASNELKLAAEDANKKGH